MMDLRKISLRIAQSSDAENNVGQAIRLGQLVEDYYKLRFGSEIAYRNHADRLRGPWRDSVVEHWSKHAEEHRTMIYDLSMKMMTVLGMDPRVDTGITMPETPSLEAFLEDLESRARQLLSIGQQILDLNIGTEFRVMIENQMLTDSQHLSDVLRMKPTGPTLTT